MMSLFSDSKVERAILSQFKVIFFNFNWKYVFKNANRLEFNIFIKRIINISHVVHKKDSQSLIKITVKIKVHLQIMHAKENHLITKP